MSEHPGPHERYSRPVEWIERLVKRPTVTDQWRQAQVGMAGAYMRARQSLGRVLLVSAALEDGIGGISEDLLLAYTRHVDPTWQGKASLMGNITRVYRRPLSERYLLS